MDTKIGNFSNTRIEQVPMLIFFIISVTNVFDYLRFQAKMKDE